MHRIGIDLGGTKTELIVTGENPLDVIERKRGETERSGYEALLKQLEDLVDSVGNLALENPAVGLGAPGFVDPKTGRTISKKDSECRSGWSTMPTALL